MYLLKLDGNGDVLWTTTVGSPQVDKGTAIALADDGSILLAGYTNSGGLGGYDGWLVKTTAGGLVLWEKFYGGTGWDFLYDIEPMVDGGWLLSGSTYSAGEGGSDGWALRVDAEGVVIWERTFGGSTEDELRSAKQTSDSGYILAGTIAKGDTSDAWVIRLDPEAVLVWERHFGGDSADLAMDILETLDGGFSAVGSTKSFSVWTEHLHFKLSAAGDSLWTRNFGQINDQEAMEHVELPSGRFATVGYTKTSGGGQKDLFALLSDPDGAYVVQHTYGYLEDEVGYSIARTEDGFIVCGTTTSFPTAGGVDVYVARCDSVVDTDTELVTPFLDPTIIRQHGGAPAFITLFPNPATDMVALSASFALRGVHLIDLQGRPAREWRFPVPRDLDLRGLAAGTYQLVTWSDANVRTSQPLIIAPY